MACDCIEVVNERLQAQNGVLVTTFPFNAPRRIAVAVDKFKTGRGTRAAPRVVATFCPFCGVRYREANTSPQASQEA